MLAEPFSMCPSMANGRSAKAVAAEPAQHLLRAVREHHHGEREAQHEQCRIERVAIGGKKCFEHRPISEQGYRGRREFSASKTAWARKRHRGLRRSRKRHGFSEAEPC